MIDNNAELASLIERLGRLERRNLLLERKNRLTALFGLSSATIILVALAAGASFQNRDGIVEAREFRLLDKNNQLRGRFATTGEGRLTFTALTLFSGDDKVGVRLVATSQMSTVICLDGEGRDIGESTAASMLVEREITDPAKHRASFGLRTPKGLKEMEFKE